MGIVDHQPGALPRGQFGQLAERRHIPVHAEQAVRGDHRAVRTIGQDERGVGGVRVPVAQQARTGQARAVDQRGMIQPVLQNRLTAPGEGAEHTEIGHVAGREQQRPLPPGKGREFRFELLVRCAVPGDQVCRAAPRAKLRAHRLQRRDDLRMPRQPQVIVAAEHAQRLPVHEHASAIAGRRIALDDAPLPALRRGGKRCECGADVSAVGAQECASDSVHGGARGRMPSRASSARSRATSGLPVVSSFSP